MTDEEERINLLLQYLEGHLDEAQTRRVEERLGEDLEWRKAVVEIAEQAVMVGDWARTDQAQKAMMRREAFHSTAGSRGDQANWIRDKAWWILIASGFLAMVGVSGFAYTVKIRHAAAKVESVTGALQYIESSGKSHDSLVVGVGLFSGDTVESRSCDSWITLALAGKSRLTIAGNSSIRLMHSVADLLRFELLKGSLWFSPAEKSTVGRQIVVSTPVFEVAFGDAMLNIQTSATESIVRVDRGTVRLVRRLDGEVISVESGQQVHLRLGNRDPFGAVAQPSPVAQWGTSQMQGGEEIFGAWLTPLPGYSLRIGTSPLLWTVPNGDPVMLYVISIPAWRCSRQPVLLHGDSVLRFRGRMRWPTRVRFGFSAQKMYGVFAGKFEIDIPGGLLGPAGELWEVAIPLRDFQPLNPYLSSVPMGLELNDVYALTIEDHPGLEIIEIELSRSPGDAAQDRQSEEVTQTADASRE
jgi:hypothetical protein